jgi:hypothetical protein
MIHEVDRALTTLLEGALGGAATVTFEPVASAAEGSARKGARTVVDLHLLDVREDGDAQHAGYARAVRDDGAVMRTAPTRWFRLSYWLTVWGADPADEHATLSTALGVLAGHEALPSSTLTGSLAEAGRPVRLSVAMPAATETFAATVWASLGVPMKGALHVVVRAPVGPPAGAATEKPVTDRDLRMTGPPPPRKPDLSSPPAGIPGVLMPGAPPPPPPPPVGAPGAPGAPAAAPKPPAGAPGAPPAAPKPPEPEPEPEPKPPLVEALRYGPDPTAPPQRLEPDPPEQPPAPSGA